MWLVILLAGCVASGVLGTANTPGTPTDTGVTDTGDTGVADTGDTGVADTGDTGVTDTGDTGVTDTGDTGVTDTGDTGVTDTGDTGDTGVTESSEFWNDCGPGALAGVRLGIDPGAPQACDVAVGGYHQLEFWLWRHLPSADNLPATLTIDDTYTKDGSAEWCMSPTAACEPAVSGTIEFTGYVDGTSAAGTYSVKLADGQQVDGSFSATFCENNPMNCG